MKKLDGDEIFWLIWWGMAFVAYIVLTKSKNMGLFDIISDLTVATVKVALTPVAIVKDAVSVVTGESSDATKDLLKSAGKDLENAKNEIIP